MCCILQARFLPNPLPMTSALPGQTATAPDTTRDTAQEGAKHCHREGDRGRERGGATGCHVFLCLLKKKKKNGWCISAAMETYLVTAPAPCTSCPSRDLQHSTSSLKQRGEHFRLDNDWERQEHERDYTPWDEARVTVSWIGVKGFVIVVSLGKWATLRLPQEIMSCVWGKWGTLEAKVSMDKTVSWCNGLVNVQHWNLHSVKTVTSILLQGNQSCCWSGLNITWWQETTIYAGFYQF